MRIFRHLFNYNELKPTMHFLFLCQFQKKKQWYQFFLLDSIGSLSSKLEQNGPNHDALSHAKFICSAVLKSCYCFSSCTLECFYGKIKLFFFSVHCLNFQPQSEKTISVLSNFNIKICTDYHFPLMTSLPNSLSTKQCPKS